MDKERLKEIAERAAKATPGPWIQSYLQPLYTVTMDSAVVVSGAEFNEDGSVDFIFADNESQAGENLRFIARARTDIPDLLAHIHTLEEALTLVAELDCADPMEMRRIARAALAPPVPATREMEP